MGVESFVVFHHVFSGNVFPEKNKVYVKEMEIYKSVRNPPIVLFWHSLKAAQGNKGQ
jgi:hypothetical protein